MLRKLKRLFKSRPKVAVLRLAGVIGSASPYRSGLTLSGAEDQIKRAFSVKGAKAVALSVNSPGGAPVQSAMLYKYIRALAKEKKIPVYSFAEDVAASGGYFLLCAGDEIYAESSSVIGSIGVISAGFGFQEAIKKLGIERRVHAEGKNKSVLDPFQPEKAEDIDLLKEVQKDIHENFKEIVKSSRAGKLKAGEEELFTGKFWSGRRAFELGLVDGVAVLHEKCREKFGPRVKFENIAKSKGWLERKLDFLHKSQAAPLLGIKQGIEESALFSRYGL